MLTDAQVYCMTSIYFDHHLPLKPSIGKRRKQSCTPNISLIHRVSSKKINTKLNFFSFFVREKFVLYNSYHDIYEKNLFHPIKCIKLCKFLKKKTLFIFEKMTGSRIDSKSIESFVKYFTLTLFYFDFIFKKNF